LLKSSLQYCVEYPTVEEQYQFHELLGPFGLPCGMSWDSLSTYLPNQPLSPTLHAQSAATLEGVAQSTYLPDQPLSPTLHAQSAATLEGVAHPEALKSYGLLQVSNQTLSGVGLANHDQLDDCPMFQFFDTETTSQQPVLKGGISSHSNGHAVPLPSDNEYTFHMAQELHPNTLQTSNLAEDTPQPTSPVPPSIHSKGPSMQLPASSNISMILEQYKEPSRNSEGKMTCDQAGCNNIVFSRRCDWK
jgi:hypothetical protein